MEWIGDNLWGSWEWELYDVVEDQSETNDLAAWNPKRVGELDGLYHNWAERVGVVPWDELE